METIEYIIGFAVSTSVALFSIFVLSGAAPLLGMFISSTSHSQVVDAARQAVQQNASATVTLNLSDTSISCQHGIMTVAGATDSYSSEVGSDCAFSISGLSGNHRLVFVSAGSQLRARVDG